MTKRGVEPLRAAFFQAAFSASQHDPESKAYYQRKRTQGIFTRRLRSQQPYRPQEVHPLKSAA